MEKKIVIFEDNERLRETLKFVIDENVQFRVVGDFGDCKNAGTIVRQLEPDVVIMDIDMPFISGIEGTRLIKEARPETLIIMHTVFENSERLFESLCAGANGYLIKNSSFVHLLEGIETVLNGGSPLTPAIARKVVDSFLPAPKNYQLSPREKEVLQYLIKGFSYKMIAASLCISLATVQTHIKNIYIKLHVNCGREAVAVALRDKIV